MFAENFGRQVFRMLRLRNQLLALIPVLSPQSYFKLFEMYLACAFSHAPPPQLFQPRNVSASQLGIV